MKLEELVELVQNHRRHLKPDNDLGLNLLIKHLGAASFADLLRKDKYSPDMLKGDLKFVAFKRFADSHNVDLEDYDSLFIFNRWELADGYQANSGYTAQLFSGSRVRSMSHKSVTSDSQAAHTLIQK